MSRQSLKKDIAIIDQRLSNRYQQLAAIKMQSKDIINEIPPYTLPLLGFSLGVFVNTMGIKKVYSLLSVVHTVTPALQRYVEQFSAGPHEK